MKIPRIVRDASVQAMGSYVATAAQMIRGLVIARLLAPTGVGTVAAVGLVLSYGQYADLGIIHGVGRQIPYDIGAGNLTRAQLWDRYAMMARIIAGGTIAIALVAYSTLRAGELPGNLRFGLYTATAVILMQGLSTAQQAILRARRQFGQAAFLTAAAAILNLLASAVGVFTVGVKGVFVGQVIAFTLAFLLGLKLGVGRTLLPIEWSKFVPLLRIGFPLSILAFVSYNLIWIDQAVILTYLGRAHLGIYSITLYVSSGLFLIPTVVATTIAPRLLERYGEHKTLGSIGDLAWRPVRFLSIVMPLVIALAWILIPIAIRVALPNYTAAIGPTRIYLVGLFFLSLNLGVSDTLLALNKHRRNIPVLVSAVIFNIAIDTVFVRNLGWGLPGVAAGSAVTYFLYWFTSSSVVRWLFESNLKRILVFNLAQGWPGALLAAFAVISLELGNLNRTNLPTEMAFLAVVTIITAARWSRENLLRGADPTSAPV